MARKCCQKKDWARCVDLVGIRSLYLLTVRTSADQLSVGHAVTDQSPAQNRRDKKREGFEKRNRYGNDMIGLTWSAIPPKVLDHPPPGNISAQFQDPSAVSGLMGLGWTCRTVTLTLKICGSHFALSVPLSYTFFTFTQFRVSTAYHRDG